MIMCFPFLVMQSVQTKLTLCKYSYKYKWYNESSLLIDLINHFGTEDIQSITQNTKQIINIIPCSQTFISLTNQLPIALQ